MAAFDRVKVVSASRAGTFSYFIYVRGLEDGNKRLHQQTIVTPLRQLRREPTSRLPGTTKLGSIIEVNKLIARLIAFNFDIDHLHFSGRAFGSAAAVGAAGPAAAAPLAASARNKDDPVLCQFKLHGGALFLSVRVQLH